MSVSLICACKNRENALKISLTSWIMFEEIKEIIIVDWNSENSLEYLAEWDPKIKIVRVDNETYFNQPQPLNLAASIATQKYLLKFDIDYVLNPYYNFFEKNCIDDNCFLCGENTYDIINEPYYRFLWGLLYVSKENFFKVGGYNEHMDVSYSFEDEELNIRLTNLGLKKIHLDFLPNIPDSIFHIAHPNSLRSENFKFSKISKVKNIENRLFLNLNYVYNRKNFFPVENTFYVKPKLKWEISQISPQIYKAKKHIL